MQEIFTYHKFALGPILGLRQPAIQVIQALPGAEKKKLINFILENGLGPLWHKLLRDNTLGAVFSDELTERLRNSALFATARYLRQQQVVLNVAKIFSDHDIDYAFFKGAHTKELVYPAPTLRPAVDVDVLIHPDDRNKILKLLVHAGFTVSINQDNIDHELTCFSHNVPLDLHWNIMRPARLRKSFTEECLASSKMYQVRRGLNEETTLFILLVHPVFTEYLTTRLTILIKIVDLFYWIKTRDIDWDILVSLLKKYGTCTAAWLTASYLQELTGLSLPDAVLQQIKPHPLKRRYLLYWIRNNLAEKMLQHRFLIQTGLTLPAHDRIADVFRFLNGIRIQRNEAPEQATKMLSFLETIGES